MNLRIENDVFEEMRGEFNAVLEDTINKMCAKGTSEGSVTLKVGIELEEIRTVDQTGRMIKAMVPTFSHDVSSLVQSKVKLSGKIEGCGTIVFDDTTGGWKLIEYDAEQMEF